MEIPMNLIEWIMALFGFSIESKEDGCANERWPRQFAWRTSYMEDVL
jgi:hypothetical protein